MKFIKLFYSILSCNSCGYSAAEDYETCPQCGNDDIFHGNR